MKVKFFPVLEMCIENGITFGLNRAYKHDDAPSREVMIENGLSYGYRRAFKHTDDPTEDQITHSIRESIMHELYEWFDMEGVE